MPDEEIIPLETSALIIMWNKSLVETLEYYGLVLSARMNRQTIFIDGRSGGTGEVQPFIL